MGGLTMDIKTRIDALTETEAKASLLFLVQMEGIFLHSIQAVFPLQERKTVDIFQHMMLDEALKEARK
jgi:hypothetical protein